MEPIFEADFQEGSYGYRPKRSAHDAVERVAEAIVHYKTRVLDIDLKAYFDNIQHHRLLAQVAQRVKDPDVLHVLKLILKNTGKKGVAQGVAQGSAQEAQRILLIMGRKRFGSVPEGAETTLKGITDPARLERMAERILDAAGWDDLLATA